MRRHSNDGSIQQVPTITGLTSTLSPVDTDTDTVRIKHDTKKTHHNQMQVDSRSSSTTSLATRERLSPINVLMGNKKKPLRQCHSHNNPSQSLAPQTPGSHHDHPGRLSYSDVRKSLIRAFQSGLYQANLITKSKEMSASISASVKDGGPVAADARPLAGPPSVRFTTNHKQNTPLISAISRSHSNSSPETSGRCSPESQRSSSNVPEILSPRVRKLRARTISNSAAEHDIMLTDDGKRVYTKGRPPWYDVSGKMKQDPFVIGICGGSASGKTTVAEKLISHLGMQWVTLLSMDSFYKVLSPEQHERAASNEYNFDHPDAFDFQLLVEALERLKSGKCIEVPIYNFTTHRREKSTRTLYGADVLIFEGILAFHDPMIVQMMDLKIFVDTDSDTRLSRRLQRDICDRGRLVEDVLQQYFNHVKPAFDSFIMPCMKSADIIVPRGGENWVAVDLIVKQIKGKLTERGYDSLSAVDFGNRLLSNLEKSGDQPMPDSLRVLPSTSQIKGLFTFIRDQETERDEFVFYSKRLMRILIEYAMSLMPYKSNPVHTPQGGQYEGVCNQYRGHICGVSIMRAGETMEQALREVVKDCKMGKILIQTNRQTNEPELYYLRLPKDISSQRILIMDATVATGAAAMMAVRILLDHDVPEENISVLSVLMAELGVHSIAYAFPKVRIITGAVDNKVNAQGWILPGLGNFGDRYYGTGGDEFSGSESDGGFSDDEDNIADVNALSVRVDDSPIG